VGVNLGGEAVNFKQSIEIAQLALKHRPNKNQRQRIIAIIYSPLSEDTQQLEALGKRMKKNGVAIDIINLGVGSNITKLKSFVDTVNSADNSHFLHIEAGVGNVADMVVSSSINSNVSMTNNNPGDIDPNVDPELAEAIRQSLEEQKQMLQREEKKENVQGARVNERADDELEGLTEEEIMQRAIMLSLEGKVEEHKDSAPENQTEPMVSREEKKEDIEAQLLGNNEFVNELMGEIPEVTEEEKKRVLESLKKKEQKKETKKEDSKNEEKRDPDSKNQ